MENEDEISMLTALLDDDSNEALNEVADQVEEKVSNSKTVESKSAPSTSSNNITKKTKPKLIISSHPQQKRKAEELSKEKSSKGEGDSLWDKFSGFYIINPLISSYKLNTKMEGRKFIPVSQISSKVRGKDIDYDWVTTAVIVKKIPPKTSSNGKTYGIWKLSDLGITSANNTVALFLFGEVYKTHWKITEGSVISVLNPTILPAKEKQSEELALCLDNPQKLMLLGASRDFGHCMGHTRADGRQCSNFVNKQYGEYCEYHVNSAYKKVKSRRMEFQSSSGPPKGQLMKKLHKDMSNSTFMYQGKSLQVNSPPSQKSKSVTLSAIQNVTKAKLLNNVSNKLLSKEKAKLDDDKSGASNSKEKDPITISKSDNQPSDVFLDLLSIPTAGTRNLSKHLYNEKEQNEAKENNSATKTSASQLLKDYRRDLDKPKSSDTPMLGRGFRPGGDIVFSNKPSIKSCNSVSLARKHAKFIIQNKGPIAKLDPNAIKKKRSPMSEKTLIERVESNIDSPEEVDKISPTQTKKRRLLGPEFDEFDCDSEERKRLIKAKSLHVGQVKAMQAEREEKYFNELEKKENLEEKLNAIKEIAVMVYSCKKCNYVAESASDLCFKEHHPIKKTTTHKRFFVCKHCSQRTVSYGTKMPKLTCANCGEMNYQRTSMLVEKKGPKIAGETLLVRGIEQKYYNM